MSRQKALEKQVIIHIGPHKTGTTALQKCLSSNRSTLAGADIVFLHNSATHEAAMLIARENFSDAQNHLAAIAEVISASEAKIIILSQEDFCGSLPGRSRRRAIYPKLTRNLRLIARALKPHRIKFVFFVRDEENWLESCYHQHLRYRTQFCSFDSFRKHFDEDLSWAEKLEEPKKSFGKELIVLPYSKKLDVGVRDVLRIAGQPELGLAFPPSDCNSSPILAKVHLLERINSLSAFKATAWFAKALVINDWQPRLPVNSSEPSFCTAPDLASLAFPKLTLRATNRISPQEADDILPPENIDLSNYIFETLPKDVPQPPVSRINIHDQSLILDYHFRGKSRLAKLTALTISYLRRDTIYTNKARHLFHRIWREHGPLLVNEFSTRWLISTLQTFLDHGESESQRIIGAAGHYYANMMKIYEGERSIEGHDQDATYRYSEPQTLNKFKGLDRYRVGGTDLLLNTNALAVDLAMRDDVAGLVLFELLLRVKESSNVFTRMDRTRKEKGIEEPGFLDTWSFFDPQ